MPASSPMYVYDAFTGNASTGWQTLCSAPAEVWRCDDYTAHITSAAVSVSLSFVGETPRPPASFAKELT